MARYIACTTGLIFFGTPFRGAEGMSQAELLEAAHQEYVKDKIQENILEILQPGNECLREVVDKFCICSLEQGDHKWHVSMR